MINLSLTGSVLKRGFLLYLKIEGKMYVLGTGQKVWGGGGVGRRIWKCGR